MSNLHNLKTPSTTAHLAVSNDRPMNAQMSVDNEILKPADAARHLRISLSSLNKMRCHGSGPAFHRLGRAIRYRRRDLDLWVDARRTDSTTDADHRLPRRLSDLPLSGVARRHATAKAA